MFNDLESGGKYSECAYNSKPTWITESLAIAIGWWDMRHSFKRLHVFVRLLWFLAFGISDVYPCISFFCVGAAQLWNQDREEEFYFAPTKGKKNKKNKSSRFDEALDFREIFWIWSSALPPRFRLYFGSLSASEKEPREETKNTRWLCTCGQAHQAQCGHLQPFQVLGAGRTTLHWWGPSLVGEVGRPLGRLQGTMNCMDLNLNCLVKKERYTISWVVPPPSNCGKWRFIGIPY